MKRKILLAADSPTIHRLVAQTFEDLDFELISVINGSVAVEKFVELKPSGVIADVFMPGKNGYELCSFIKNHSTLGHTPVILLVGALEEYDEKAGSKAGVNAYISKPFEPRKLLNVLISLIDTSSMDRLISQNDDQVEDLDLLGLEALFLAEQSSFEHETFTENEISRITNRVIKKLSLELKVKDFGSEIVDKVVRDSLKRDNEN